MRTRPLIVAALLTSAIALAGCQAFGGFDNQFGDQHFKTAIALIELHHARFGEYPASLKELRYKGDWDQIALDSVAYKRLPNGYSLDITRGWMGKPTLSYPAEFWEGLGVVSSNVGGLPGRQTAPEHVP